MRKAEAHTDQQHSKPVYRPCAIALKDALYQGNYELLLFFNDGTNTVVDFSSFILSKKGYLSKYKDQANFKKFRIEDGNIVWGKDWDLIFPIHQLYSGYIN